MKRPTIFVTVAMLVATVTVNAASPANDADTVFSDHTVDDTPLDLVPVDRIPVEELSREPATSTAPAESRVARASHNIPINTKLRTPNPQVENSFSFDSLNDERTRQVASALSVVLGLMLLFAVVSRTMSRRKAKPHELIEVLSRTVVSPKHTLHLVRVHDRMILLAETPNGLAQLESLASPPGTDQATDTTEPIADNEAERLLEMIRSSDSWKSPISKLEPTHLRDTSYVA